MHPGARPTRASLGVAHGKGGTLFPLCTLPSRNARNARLRVRLPCSEEPYFLVVQGDGELQITGTQGGPSGARIRRAARKELRRVKGLSLHAGQEAASARDAASAERGVHGADKPAAGAGEPDGVTFRDLVVGEGREAALGARVKLHYKVALTDGAEVDSSGRRPLAVRLGGGEAIPGLDHGVPGMREGGVRTLVIPSGLAYGSAGAGPIPPEATLVMNVELVRCQEKDPHTGEFAW